MSSALDQFHARLSSLCVAAGPPAPSFSTADIEAALACIASKEAAAPGFAAIDAKLSADLSSTPLSVRSMLWEMLVRACDRSAAQTIAQGGRDEWSVVVAPHLYRIVMLVVPKAEDAAANVPLAKQTLRRWMAAAEANSAAAPSTAAVPAPFKKPQLINALKYVEGYVYEPPRRSESELIASREAKRERKRQRRREEAEREERRRHAKANGRRKRSRSRSSHSSGSRSGSITPGSAAAASSNAAAAGGAAVPADHSPSRSVSDGGSSRSGSLSRSRSRSPSARRRYRNRSAVTHTASEEAYASRFLEQLRASQKRAHVEGSLRADNESMQGWEEWAETIDYIREGEIQQRAAEREAAAAAAAAAAATASANLAASSSPASAAFPAASPFSPAASPSSASSLSSFLSLWLSARNHWKPLRDDLGEAEGTPSEGGMHQMDQWIAYYSAAGLPLPSSLIPGGSTRLWSALNEHSASARFQGPMLPPPIPKSALPLYEKSETNRRAMDERTEEATTAMRDVR